MIQQRYSLIIFINENSQTVSAQTQQQLKVKVSSQLHERKTSLLPLSFVGFGFACSCLVTAATLSHSLLSDIFRLLFDLVVLELSEGGLLAFLAASWACNEQHRCVTAHKSHSIHTSTFTINIKAFCAIHKR